MVADSTQITLSWDFQKSYHNELTPSSVAKLVSHLQGSATFTPLQKCHLSLLFLTAIYSFNPQWFSLFQIVKWQPLHIRYTMMLKKHSEELWHSFGTFLNQTQ